MDVPALCHALRESESTVRYSRCKRVVDSHGDPWESFAICVGQPRKKLARLHALLRNLQNCHGLRQILFHVVEESFLEKHGVLMRGFLGGVSVSPRNRVNQVVVIAPKLCCGR